MIQVYFLQLVLTRGLASVVELDAQMFSLAQMFNRIPNVQFSTEAPLLQNPC
jgi:hypothetical protein